jgi:hypothetical protein
MRGLRLFPRGGGVRVVTQACSGPRLLLWHSVGDNGAVLGGFFRPFSPRLRWCRVLLGELFACVVVVVVFASACDVQLLLLLK